MVTPIVCRSVDLKKLQFINYDGCLERPNSHVQEKRINLINHLAPTDCDFHDEQVQ